MRPKLLYQLTSPMHRTLGTGEIDRRRVILAAAAADATVEVSALEDGPAAVESRADAALVVPELLKLAPSWVARGYDAVVVGCFSDPGLEALRDVVTIPVVGPGTSAMQLAAQFGEGFSVLSSEPTPKGLRARVHALGLAHRFVSERTVGCSVLDLVREPVRAFDGIVAASRACVEDGADILVLGCMGMGFMPGLCERLRDAVGVPVVNSVLAGLGTAVMAARLGLRGPAAVAIAA